MKIKAYFHASREVLIAAGARAGLSEQAAYHFSFAEEVGIEFEVNAETGTIESATLFYPELKNESQS